MEETKVITKTKEELYKDLSNIISKYGIYGEDNDCLAQDIVSYFVNGR